MHLGGSTALHSAVAGVGGLAGASFGGGRYRCPGRYFAEAELALVTSLLVLLYDMELVPPGQEQQSRQGAGPRLRASTQQDEEQRQQQQQQQRPARQQAEQEQRGEHAPFPGDPSGLLPPPDLRRLVGIKVPAGPCWVQLRRRALPGG
jgi:hypothetical protein